MVRMVRMVRSLADQTFQLCGGRRRLRGAGGRREEGGLGLAPDVELRQRADGGGAEPERLRLEVHRAALEGVERRREDGPGLPTKRAAQQNTQTHLTIFLCILRNPSDAFWLPAAGGKLPRRG